MYLISLELPPVHVDESDCRKTNWLPVEERAELCVGATFLNCSVMLSKGHALVFI